MPEKTAPIIKTPEKQKCDKKNLVRQLQTRNNEIIGPGYLVATSVIIPGHEKFAADIEKAPNWMTMIGSLNPNISVFAIYRVFRSAHRVANLSAGFTAPGALNSEGRIPSTYSSW
jgi:hypothetical protein